MERVCCALVLLEKRKIGKKKKIESSYLYRYFYKIDLRENLIKFERREEKK